MKAGESGLSFGYILDQLPSVSDFGLWDTSAAAAFRVVKIPPLVPSKCQYAHTGLQQSDSESGRRLDRVSGKPVKLSLRSRYGSRSGIPVNSPYLVCRSCLNDGDEKVLSRPLSPEDCCQRGVGPATVTCLPGVVEQWSTAHGAFEPSWLAVGSNSLLLASRPTLFPSGSRLAGTRVDASTAVPAGSYPISEV